MVAKKTKKSSLDKFRPIILGLGVMLISAIIYFSMNLGFSSSCAGNAGCIVIIPLYIIPAFSFIYGLALIPAFFKKDNNKEKYKNVSVYKIAFKIAIIIGLIVAVIPWIFLLQKTLWHHSMIYLDIFGINI